MLGFQEKELLLETTLQLCRKGKRRAGKTKGDKRVSIGHRAMPFREQTVLGLKAVTWPQAFSTSVRRLVLRTVEEISWKNQSKL